MTAERVRKPAEPTYSEGGSWGNSNAPAMLGLLFAFVLGLLVGVLLVLVIVG